MKKSRYLLAASLLAASAIGASALNVSSTAGNLKSAVGENTDASTLSINGTIDASDFDFIREKMTSLTSIDLSGAKIEAYDGFKLANGNKQEMANAIPMCAFLGTKLESVILPESLTAIEDGAFGGTDLKKIEIPSKVESIGTGAFSNTPLTSVTLPASVVKLGTGVFKDCASLLSADLSKTSLKTVPASSFALCGKLSAVSLPADISEIGDEAFNGCASMTDFPFPATLMSLGEKAFAGSGLINVDFTDCTSLSSVGPWCFVTCNDLASVTFTPSVSSLGEGAFYHDSGAALELAVLAQSALTEIPDYAFTNVENAIPDGFGESKITSVGNYAFAGWKASKITMPETLEKLGDGAMANWTALKDIDAQTLNVVPELGQNVWEGVDQPKATLTVASDMKTSFENADQWKEFNIEANQSTSIDAVVGESSKINVRFNGMHLSVDATDHILKVELYDIQGRALTSATPNAANTSIDTSAFDANVYIVRVALKDHTRATFKLAR